MIRLRFLWHFRSVSKNLKFCGKIHGDGTFPVMEALFCHGQTEMQQLTIQQGDSPCFVNDSL